MTETTIYITIKCQVQHLDGEPIDNIICRVAEGADYNIDYADDICEVIKTKMVDASTSSPK